MHRSPTAILDSSCSRLALPYLILNPPSAGMVGGLPIVIFTGDFLQFGPIHLLTSNKLRRRANDRKVQRYWWQLMAKKLWEK